jgi:hypothetical protein
MVEHSVHRRGETPTGTAFGRETETADLLRTGRQLGSCVLTCARSMRTLCVFFATPLFLFVSAGARADAPPVAAPPPDTAALVAAPKANEDVPKFDPQTNETTATVSAGGQLSTGNSQQAAVTGNGKFAMRRGADAFGAAIIGNYGEGASPGQGLRETTENLQGRLRSDSRSVSTSIPASNTSSTTRPPRRCGARRGTTSNTTTA